MPLTHNTLMTLPLNKMIADTNGLYFKRTGPQKGTWTNKKHAFVWYSSLKRMAFPILDKKPLAAIDEDDITALLTPLWQTKRETAKKLQGRIKIVFAFAKFKKLYRQKSLIALAQDTLEEALKSTDIDTYKKCLLALKFFQIVIDKELKKGEGYL